MTNHNWRGAVRIVRDCDDVMDLLEIIRLGGRL